ncbi:MAG: YfhO family protein [Gemmatimonadales bacterium]
MTAPDDSRPQDRSLPKWVPAVVFALLTLVVFRRYIFSPAGSMLIGNDTIAAGVMMRSFFVEQFHQLGRLPLWNPYLYGGVPTIEAGSGDILYPPAFILHMLLPLVPALAWKLILHVFLAGFAMYGCARAYGASRPVALFAGVAWLLSANLVSLVLGGQDGKMYVITLFPAALGLLVSALDRPSWVKWIWFGAAAGLLLTAHPQLSFYAWVALGLYALVAVFNRRQEGTKLLGLRLGGGVLSLAIALGVALIVLLPMYKYLKDVSPRAGAGLTYEIASSYALNPEEVVNFVVPDFSGANETYWGRNPLKHNSEYGGVVVFALGIAGLLALKGDRRRIGLGLMAGVALLYALGNTTPAFRLMFATIPGLKRFRAPSLATFIALTALTILAVLLLERIFAAREAKETKTAVRTLAVFGGLSLLLAIAVQGAGASALGPWNAIWGASPRFQAFDANAQAIVLGGILSALWCGLAAGALVAWQRGMLGVMGTVGVLAGVTAVDLLRVDTPYIQVAPYDQLFPEDQLIQDLNAKLPAGERVVAFPSGQIFNGGGPDGGYLATFRVEEVFGYHSNQLRWYDQLTRRDLRDGGDARTYWEAFVASPALRSLSARILILPTVFHLTGVQPLGKILNDQVTVYRDSLALGAATVVPNVEVEADSVKRLDRLWDPAFDVAKTALVDAPVPAIGSGGGTGTAKLVTDGADSLTIEATSTGPAMLLVSRTYHPSWTATIDGQAASTIRVNHALIGVPLPQAGTHQVSLMYRPAIVAQSKMVTTATWVIVLLTTLVALGLGWRERARA